MVVSWIPLSYSEAMGFISHYTVVYFPQGNGRKRQGVDMVTQNVSGMDASTTRIEGLDANADYIAQVSATNGAGTSILSQGVVSVSFDVGCELHTCAIVILLKCWMLHIVQGSVTNGAGTYQLSRIPSFITKCAVNSEPMYL
jgi:hypothetical protein